MDSQPAIPPQHQRPPSPAAPKNNTRRQLPNVQWDRVILTFFRNAGLTECCKAFELDMLVMSPQFERERIPAAVGELLKDLMTLGQPQASYDRELEDRKLDYLPTVQEPLSRTSHNAAISRFIAQSKARNNRSNRNEFLRQTLSAPAPTLGPAGNSDSSMDIQAATTPPSSAARTSAKNIDRDIQMAYDIVKHAEGPLKRTTREAERKEAMDAKGQGRGGLVPGARIRQEGKVTLEGYPVLEERLGNVEDHLAVRYVPGPPEDLRLRLKALEDHIIRLEKEYPPWAALHFNQPQRGWPPPPRSTPIIVPSHLTAMEPSSQPAGPSTSSPADVPVASGSHKPRKAKTESSLQRAVLEKLEVQKALQELKGAHSVSKG